MTAGWPAATVADVTAMNSPAHRWPMPSDLPAWVVAFMVLLFQLAGSTGAEQNAAYPHTKLDHFGYTLLTVGALSLLARRRHPVAVLIATALCTLAYHLHGYAQGPFFVAQVTSMISAVALGRRTAAWSVGFASVAAFLALGWLPQGSLIRAHRPSLTIAVALAVYVFAVLAAGELVRFRAERAAEARRIRAERERRMAGEERLRIARELHDVLAHNISMINVQAGVALHLMEEQPEHGWESQAHIALTAIKAASKEALTEMRSVIGVLRQQGERAPTTPTAGLDRLDALVQQARTAGLRVEVERAGKPYDLPAGADLAVFRIIQESLTNAARHARPGAAGYLTVRIRLSFEAGTVAVRIDDDGVGGQFGGEDGGSGIPGMRERAVALDGEFTAGPRPGGGFRVEARLPAAAEEAE